MEDNILQQISHELKFYSEEVLDCNPSYAPTADGLLDLIEKYWNSKFLQEEYDADNFKYLFFNIVRFRVKTSSKATDVDTKNIRLMADDGASYYPAWFLSKELKKWMDDNEFAELLNKIRDRRPRYGEVVLKKAKDKIHLMELNNIVWDPTVDLEKSDFSIEKHFFTPQQLRKQKKWDNVEEVITHWRSKRKKGEYIEIYERYGEVPESWLEKEGDEKKYVMAMFIEYSYSDTFDKGLNLAKAKASDKPYMSLKWEEKPGRGMGEGVIEELSENQIAVNEDINMRHKALFWTTLHLYQTHDELIQRNLLADARDGDVIKVLSDIKPIMTEERNLSHYAADISDWMTNASQGTFTQEAITGAKLAAGTPWRLGQLEAQMSGQYFEQKVEEFGVFIKKVLFKWVLPEFEKKRKAEHVLKFFGEEDELKKLDNLIVQARAERKVHEYLKDKKRVPSAEEVELMKSLEAKKLTKSKERYLSIPKEFYKNIKYKIDILITYEQIDVANKMATLQTAFSMIAANPEVLRNPQLKKAFYKLLEWGGISPIEFEAETELPSLEETIIEQLGRKGARAPVARQRMPVSPAPAAPAEATI